MKIFILSDSNSIHTKRWVKSLAKRGINVFLFSLYKNLNDDYWGYENLQVYGCYERLGESFSRKMSYLFVLGRIKQKIKEFKPNIVHAHYASSYGLLGALCNFQPYIVSVWGSDVYDFPNTNWFTRQMLKYTLKKADRILSTSHVMAKETCKYTNKRIIITPFGVDVNRFKNLHIERKNKFVVGNVKTLSPKYGIDILIKAFKIVVQRNPCVDVELIIVGDGPNRIEYEELVIKLGLEKKVRFEGKVLNEKLPEYYNRFSLSVFASVLNSESFGVVAVEAMACECPVITSDADGFTEVVKDGETGLIIPKRDVEATANAIQRFIDHPELREEMGKKGRERVLELYDWEKNVDTMIKIYNRIYEDSIN